MLQLQDEEKTVILEIAYVSKGNSIDCLTNNTKSFIVFSGEDPVGNITYDPAKSGHAAEFPADLALVI